MRRTDLNKTDNDDLLKGLVMDHLRRRYAKQYSSVVTDGESTADIVLSNHGLKIAALCIETERSLNGERAQVWRSVIEEGMKLILVVPSRSKSKVTSLLWDMNLMSQVSIGTYEINISVPL